MREPLQCFERECAHFGILQGDDLTAMHPIINSIESDDLTRHVITGHLLVTLFAENHRLAGAGADRVNSREAVGCPVQRVSSFNAHP